ncbi:hypothetical protein ACTODO_00501 [Schaalia dentiphila ATCC 17982]|nr:hypothetical protein ACTODO_00501 [Schaalia odontolytica ATCC 17982]
MLTGSSPLTRGKRVGTTAGAAWQDLIPAHAGKTAQRARANRASAAHPRSRGENSPMRTAISSLAGSSPLTRGKLSGSLFGGFAVGLIPAHAGKTTG